MFSIIITSKDEFTSWCCIGSSGIYYGYIEDCRTGVFQVSSYCLAGIIRKIIAGGFDNNIAHGTSYNAICSREDSKPIDGAIDIGYKHACGTQLFDEINSELANVAVAITKESATQLQNAICKGFKGTPMYRNKPVSQSDRLEQFPARHDEVVATRVRLDTSTCYCSVTKTQQHIASLSPEQKKIFYDDVLASVKDSHGHEAERRLKEFAEWLG